MSSRSSGGQNDNNNKKKKAAATKKSTNNNNNNNNQKKNKRSGSNNDTNAATITKTTAAIAVGTTGNSKNKTTSTSTTTSGSTTTGDAAKTLLVLARQDSTMADRQQLLRTMIQIGASPAVIQEVYNMSPSRLTLDVLFEAGKLQATTTPVKKLLLQKFGEQYTNRYNFPNNILAGRSFVLRRDPHLVTSGNVCEGLQLVLQTNIGILKAYAPPLPPPSQNKTTTTTTTSTSTKTTTLTKPATKPFWNLQEFSTDFLNEVIKTKNLKTLQFTFPKEPGNVIPTKAAAIDKENQLPKSKNSNTSTVVVIKQEKDENDGSSSKQEQQQQQKQQQVQVQQTTKVRTTAVQKIKDKLTRKKLEGCTLLQDVRIQFDYSHKTSDSFLQLAISLATNLPNLQTFGIQVQKSADKPKDFQQFKTALSQSIGKMILPPPPSKKNNNNTTRFTPSKTTTMGPQTLVVDAPDLTKDGDWEPLLKALEKNPPLQRLLIRGFTLPKNVRAVGSGLQDRSTRLHAQHSCLGPFKRKLLTVIQQHNTNLRDVKFFVPGCVCDIGRFDGCQVSNYKFDFDSDRCWFRSLNEDPTACSPILSFGFDPSNGQRLKATSRPFPPPHHVPELDHYLQVNAINNGSSRRILMNNNNNKSNDPLTHKQFATALMDNSGTNSLFYGDNYRCDQRVINDPSILYTLLRGHAEYIPMLLSSQQILSTTQSSNSRGPDGLNMNTEMEELYMAAAGKLALPLERFVELCLRRSDDFTSLYNLLRIFPTIWLSDLRPAKAIIQEQSKRTRKEYVSVVVQEQRTQIYKMKKTAGAPTAVVSYGARVVQTLDRRSSEEQPRPLKLIRLNVAPSVGGGTLTKFPKVAIGKNGKVVFAVKKKQAPNDGTNTDLQQQTTIRNAETTTKTATATSAAAPPPKRKKANLKKEQGGTAASKAAATATASNNNKPVKPKRKASATAASAATSTTSAAKTKSKAARIVVGDNNNKTKRKSLLKIEGLDDIKFDDDDVIVCDDDHDDDDYYAPSDDDDVLAAAGAGQGRRPRPRRRSVAAARRKVVARRRLGNDRESLSELIGESSSSEGEGAEGQTKNNENKKGGGDDSDWDAEADVEEEEEESDWDMDDDDA